MPNQNALNQTKGVPMHSPVMVPEVIKYLSPEKGEGYLDLTGGYGGHAEAVLCAAGTLSEMTLVDRDRAAVSALKLAFGTGAEVIHSDFLQASHELSQQGRRFDMILADLGASSQHLNEASRGFSFRQAGPLDMRMDTRQSVTAEQLVNNLPRAELERILVEYGQEPKANKIAAGIVAARPIASTADLAELIEKLTPKRYGRKKIHPATKSFQALRIAVNDELSQIEQSLPIWCQLLKPQGRLVVISFHSLEDRLVKQFFAEMSGERYDAELTLLTKKPVTPSRDEIVSNPRARSAKLRAVAAK